ncbi:hypothetical protein [Paractinoplanes abujensis]|uniref:Uncharacterized protein n=1 Tax=Paractinoplanes abujensis TaxID=882441 RepID=A0A7W7D328_9ACTN|nr:hypothetical protein [Actinoplanes abujensis]MBB4697911.1 hypothetical protein [Actinoplanes abujensis]
MIDLIDADRARSCHLCVPGPQDHGCRGRRDHTAQPVTEPGGTL